jgi:hypothetical protein
LFWLLWVAEWQPAGDDVTRMIHPATDADEESRGGGEACAAERSCRQAETLTAHGSLDIFERNRLLGAVIQLSRVRRLMGGHLLRLLRL